MEFCGGCGMIATLHILYFIIICNIFCTYKKHFYIIHLLYIYKFKAMKIKKTAIIYDENYQQIIK